MSPRRLLLSVITLAVVLVAAWLFFANTEHAPAPAEKPAATPSVAASSVPPPLPPTVSSSTPPAPSSSSPLVASRPSAASSPVAVAPPSPAAGIPASAASTPDAATSIAVDQVRLMLRDYRTLMGENPVGTNAEIMRALMGDNPRQARLGPPEGQTLNDQGELVDRWGTPLFFHQLSKTVMEIRSAGPDKVMWTDDDIVAK